MSRLPIAVAEAPRTDAERLASRSLADALATHALTPWDISQTSREIGTFILVRNDDFRTERILPRGGPAKFAIISRGQLRDLVADYGEPVLLVVAVTFESRESAVVPVYTRWGADKECSSGLTYYYERGLSDWTLRKTTGDAGCVE